MHDRPEPDDPHTTRIRAAEPGDAAALSALALRSKAHWGYDAAFLERCRAALTIEPAMLAAAPFFVLDMDGRPVAFYGLVLGGDEAELDYLFVDPACMGCGYGRRLWQHAVAVARRLGCTTMLIESDPNAEQFYRAMGAEVVGTRPSSAGRTLPLLRFSLPTV